MLSLSLPVVASAALPAALAAAGILHDVYTGVAMFAGVLSLYVMASLWFRYSVRVSLSAGGSETALKRLRHA